MGRKSNYTTTIENAALATYAAEQNIRLRDLMDDKIMLRKARKRCQKIMKFDNDTLYGLNHVAEVLGVTVLTLRKKIYTGNFPKYSNDTLKMWSGEDLNREIFGISKDKVKSKLVPSLNK